MSDLTLSYRYVLFFSVHVAIGFCLVYVLAELLYLMSCDACLLDDIVVLALILDLFKVHFLINFDACFIVISSNLL